MSEVKKVLVFFDTNVARSRSGSSVTRENLFAESIFDHLNNFKESESPRVEMILCVPQIVFDEVIAQAEREYIKSFVLCQEMQRCSGKSMILPTPEEMKEALVQRSKEYLLSKRIEVEPTPESIGLGVVLDRCHKKLSPFPKSGDKGFKDTVIFLSMQKKTLDSRPDIVIYLGQDAGFDEDVVKEMKDQTGSRLFLAKNGEDCKVIIDRELGLRGHLSERNGKIENLISKNFKELTLHVSRTLVDFKGKRFTQGFAVSSEGHHYIYDFGETEMFGLYNLNKDNRDILGFQVREFSLEEVRKLKGESFYAQILVDAEPIYSETTKNRTVFGNGSVLGENNLFDYRDTIMPKQYSCVQRKFAVECDLQSDTIKFLKITIV